MKILWALLITSLTFNVVCHKVVESVEDEQINITTLYPIANKTTTQNESEHKNTKHKTEATIWKIDAAFAESSLANDNSTESTEEVLIEAAKNTSKEFKPSPHLGSFEVSEEVTPTRSSGVFAPVIKKPPTAFVRSPKDEFKTIFSKIPKDIFKTHNNFPYKFDSAILTKAKNTWRPTNTLESKPTVEVPVKVPAGGLYKLQDPFKEKPSSRFPDFKEKPSLSDDDFGLEFNEDVKENSVKKRVNPWKNLLRLVTAFIPVGLIISALTPGVITIQSTDNVSQFPSRLYRRSDVPVEALPPISERCRRRLLCELHSERHYMPSPAPGLRPRNHCYRIRCEDSEALSKTLHWLLSYHRPGADHYVPGQYT